MIFENLNLKTRGKFLLIPFFDFIVALIILASILNVLFEYKVNLDKLKIQHFSVIKSNDETVGLLIETHNLLYTLIKNAKDLDEAQIYENGTHIFKHIRTLQLKIENDHSLEDMNEELKKYLIIVKEIIEMSSVDFKLATTYYGEANSQFVLLTTLFNKYQNKKWEESENYLNTISLEAEASIGNFSLISLTLMSIAIFIAFFISKLLAKELTTLIKIMNKLAKGKYLDIKDIPYKDKNDEIGEMANAVNSFKNSLEQLDLSKSKIVDINKNLEIRIQESLDEMEVKNKHLIQQSRLAQMGEMISMIAHQWRQPLAAISATSSAINLKTQLNTIEKDNLLELTDKISDYSQHLSTTIDDFREFFKPNKIKQNTNYTELVQGVLSIIEISLNNKEIVLHKNLNSKIIFNTYSNEIKQVILNLIKNAEDILIENKIEKPIITITTNNNILTISDNGGGINQDILPKIFDPYFSTKIKKDGTGLGLYMSKTIIEEHCGGKLNVSNDKDGAIFTIDLEVNK